LFRLKIAILSLVTSGLVLVLGGAYLLSVVDRIEMDRVDREVYALGESQLHVWHAKRHWEEFDRSLRSIYGPDKWQELIVLATDADYQTLFRSPHWPIAITQSAFTGFDATMEKGPIEGAADRRSAPPRPDPPRRERSDGSPERPREEREPSGLAPDRRAERPMEVLLKKPLFRTFKLPEGDWRVGIMGNQHVTMMVGMNLSGFNEDSKHVRNSLLFAIPVALGLLFAGGWLIVHRALRPVARIANTAERITVRDLGARVPESGADSEFLHLIRVINTMLERLEKSFNQAIRFSADAAHELQTPLTILQAALDDAIRSCTPDTDEQRRYAGLLEETQRIKVIIQKLLILSRADANRMLPRREQVDLSVLVLGIFEDAVILNPRLSFQSDVAPSVRLQGDPDLLKLAIQELVKNAVKYNQDSGRVCVSLTSSVNLTRLSISNTGPAIPREERDLVFERFYRVDKSRSQAVPGSGLGLSLAREIARAHGGDLRLDPATNLTTFVLSLPR
jgi:two-component system, OmpR family, heavy metal sensor histidine kinase CusS